MPGTSARSSGVLDLFGIICRQETDNMRSGLIDKKDREYVVCLEDGRSERTPPPPPKPHLLPAANTLGRFQLKQQQ